MGAWIEIGNIIVFGETGSGSLPSWERGLKYGNEERINVIDDVAPFVGAWIEIVLLIHLFKAC